MPIYSFICQKCQNSFEIEASFMEFDKRDPKKFCCPKCGSKKIKQTFTEVFFVKDNKGKNNIRCACGG
jgi:putative FmdB family regulatory protein